MTLLRSQPIALDQETILLQWTATGVHLLELNFDGSGRRIRRGRKGRKPVGTSPAFKRGRAPWRLPSRRIGPVSSRISLPAAPMKSKIMPNGQGIGKCVKRGADGDVGLYADAAGPGSVEAALTAIADFGDNGAQIGPRHGDFASCSLFLRRNKPSGKPFAY